MAVSLRAVSLLRPSFLSPFLLSSSSSSLATPSPSTPIPSPLRRPVLPRRSLPFLLPHERPRKCWLETLKGGRDGDERIGLLDLHPHIFSFSLRTDVLYDNVRWQKTYREINWEHEEDRYEMKGGGHKPWKQKGTGRARHASIRAPQWRNGGKANGKRAPTSFYYEMPKKDRIDGLRGVLTYKYLQGDLRIVDSLDLDSDDPAELEALAVDRGWGISALLISASDRLAPNTAVATSALFNISAMPVYGFNVFSALKHETLVLSLDALDEIEAKLLKALNSNEIEYPVNPPMAWPDPAISGQFKFKTFDDEDWDIEERHLQMPFTPRGDGHVTVKRSDGSTVRVQDPIPPAPKVAWHRVGEEGRWVYQYEDIESERN